MRRVPNLTAIFSEAAAFVVCGCSQQDALVEGNDSTSVADDSSTRNDSGDPTGDPDTSPGTVGGTESGDEETTTAVPACDGDDDCVDEAAPFCGDAGKCVACDTVADGDAACAAKFAELGICNAGACVECTTEDASACSGTSPICDEGTFSCGPCTAHEQCGRSEACNIAAGSCFPETAVVHVDRDGGRDYEEITEALLDREDPELLIVLHQLGNGETPYQYAGLTVEDRTVAIFAAEGETPIIQGTGGNPGMSIERGATLYLKGVRLQTISSGRGLEIDGASAYVERCVIARSSGGGIQVSNNGYLRLVNSFVAGNGNQFQATHGLDAGDGTVEVVYSSFVANDGNSADSLVCSGGATVTVRNSILLGADEDSISCAAALISYSAIDSNADGTENERVDLNPAHFGGLPADASLTRAGASTFEDIARWRTGDPPTDYDGDPRPDTAETPDYPGADRLN